MMSLKQLHKLDAKVNSIVTSGFVLKTKYDTDISELENKIPDTCGLVKRLIMIIRFLKYKVKFLMLLILEKKLH